MWLQAALTVRPPHVMLFPHPSFTDDQLSSLIIRLEVNPPGISYTNSSVRPFRDRICATCHDAAQSCHAWDHLSESNVSMKVKYAARQRVLAGFARLASHIACAILILTCSDEGIWHSPA